jgi:signal transduction histidine kinase
MRPELAALVAHDLKNALGALEQRLHALQLAPAAPLARRAHHECSELRQRFVMFLMLYSLDGDLAALRSDESPRDFVEHLARRLGPTDDGATLRTQVAAETPLSWHFDPRLVRLALEAAVHNARRFARHEIVLGARGEGGYLVLSVADDGPGLGGGDSEAASTGLGTELCAAVARVHGNSRHPGRSLLSNRPEGGTLYELWIG